MMTNRPDGQHFATFIEQARRAKAERQCAERLAEWLRQLDMDPDAFEE